MKVCEGTIRFPHGQVVFDEEREKDCPTCEALKDSQRNADALSDARDAIATLQRTNEELEQTVAALEQEKQAAIDSSTSGPV